MEGYCNFSPDLAVEILSPDDNASRVQKKVTDYLAAGSTAVWVVDPATVTVSVFHKAGTFRTLKADDEIGFPEVLSNWRVPVKSFFE